MWRLFQTQCHIISDVRHPSSCFRAAHLGKPWSWGFRTPCLAALDYRQDSCWKTVEPYCWAVKQTGKKDRGKQGSEVSIKYTLKKQSWCGIIRRQ